MKSNHFYKFNLIIFSFLFFFVSKALANEDIETKVKNLTLELRCMTCQNQSIYDSDADFSIDIKNIIREKFLEGKSEKDIKKFLVERYGEYILFKPLFDYKNLFLWGFPFTLLVFGLVFFIILSRKR